MPSSLDVLDLKTVVVISVQGVEYGILFLMPHLDSINSWLFFYDMMLCDWRWLFFHTDCHGRKFSIRPGNGLMAGFWVCGAKLGCSCIIRLVCWQHIVLFHPGILRKKVRSRTRSQCSGSASESWNAGIMSKKKKDLMYCRLQTLNFPTVECGGITYHLLTSVILYTPRRHCLRRAKWAMWIPKQTNTKCCYSLYIFSRQLDLSQSIWNLKFLSILRLYRQVATAAAFSIWKPWTRLL